MGNPYAVFDVAGVGNVIHGGNVNPTGNRKSWIGNPPPKVHAPVLDPTGEFTLSYHKSPYIIKLNYFGSEEVSFSRELTIFGKS